MGSTKVFRKLEIFGELPNRWKCQLCHRVMLDPIQTRRGESACAECYTKAQGDSALCPIDRQPVDPKQKFFKDRAKEREIFNLKTHCTNKDLGCDWEGNVREFLKHSNVCLFNGDECDTCQQVVISNNEVKHFNKCSMLTKSGKCFFEQIGCKQKETTPGDIIDHMNKDNNYHLSLLMSKVLSLSTKNTELEDASKAKDKTIDQLQCTIQNLASAVQGMEKRFYNELADIKSQLAEKDQGKSKGSPLPPPAPPATAVANTTNLSEKHQQIIEDVDLRLQLHENSTYDGNLIWKIDNYTKRKTDAINGKVKALHSAPCFTSQYGYKYCLRLFLNGDGTGRNKYISLYLVIMKSEYDSILDWPFTKKVTFKLVNQINQGKNIVEKMVPNGSSSSFQQPSASKEMNIASGCPQFYEIGRVETEGFLKDDSIFIQVKIE